MHIENFLSILQILNTVIKCDVYIIEGLGAIRAQVQNFIFSL